MTDMTFRSDPSYWNTEAIEKLEEIGISSTGEMVKFEVGGTKYYSPLYEAIDEDRGLTSRLFPAFETDMIYEATSPGGTGAAILYTITNGERTNSIFIDGIRGKIRMKKEFEPEWDFYSKICEELSEDREYDIKLEEDALLVHHVDDNHTQQYAGLVTALFVDEALKTLPTKDLGNILEVGA